MEFLANRPWLKTAWKALLPAILLLWCARRAKPQESNPVVEDVSEGAVFHFTIHAGLAPHTFKLVADPEFKTIDHIEAFIGSEARPVQTLTECQMEEQPYRGADWFRAEDFNFDGYKDLRLLIAWGATGNENACIWLFDPQTGRFAFSPEFSEIGTYKLNAADKTITTTSVGGMAGSIHDFRTYKVTGNRPLLIEEEEQTWDNQACSLLRVVRKRQDGKLVVFSREHVKADAELMPAECRPPDRPR
ncbi:MAG: hypothetical protein ACE145_13940 [Terriglobia bacterium]